jgi:hypothetical protein
MSCATLGTATINGAAGRCQCPEAAGTLQTALPATWNKRRLMRTKPEVRQMIAAIRKTAAQMPDAHPDLGNPQELIRQLESVLDGRETPRDLLPPDVKNEDAARHPVYGWLAGLSWPWSDLDRYLPHRGLRGCLITKDGGKTAIRKIMGDGTLLDSKPDSTASEITAWLEENDYKQTGALLKREGEGRNDGEKAVVYLRPWDSPELLSDVMGHPIAPATLAYYPAEDKIATNRPRENILRARSKNWSASRDLGVEELPTKAQRMRVYGIED